MAKAIKVALSKRIDRHCGRLKVIETDLVVPIEIDEFQIFRVKEIKGQGLAIVAS